MSNIKIIADSTCDLSKELLEQYDISIIPLSINVGDKSYMDGNVVENSLFKYCFGVIPLYFRNVLIK